jgi:hypothetical protein
MKKFNLLIGFILIVNVVMSQISPIKEFTGWNLSVTILNSKSIYIVSDSTSISFYNENFELEKTITGLPKFGYLSLVSKNVFTTSGRYEFVLRTTDEQYKLYDEQRNMIYNFEDYMPWGPINNKLQASTASMVNGRIKYHYKFFSIQGTLSIPEAPGSVELNTVTVYPNPAQSSVNIKYNIPGMELFKIIDASGREVENILLDPYQNEMILNTSKYPKGIYIYTCGNTSGKMVIQ